MGSVINDNVSETRAKVELKLELELCLQLGLNKLKIYLKKKLIYVEIVLEVFSFLTTELEICHGTIIRTRSETATIIEAKIGIERRLSKSLEV